MAKAAAKTEVSFSLRLFSRRKREKNLFFLADANGANASPIRIPSFVVTLCLRLIGIPRSLERTRRDFLGRGACR